MEQNKQLEIWPKEKCKRLVVIGGKITEIECENHAYSWSGKMPCTGVYRCVFCGKIKIGGCGLWDQQTKGENRDE